MISTRCVFFVLSALFFIVGCGPEGQVAAGLTERGVRALALGMTEAEIVALIGEPLWIYVKDYCDGYSMKGGYEMKETCQKWTYAEMGGLCSGWSATVRIEESQLVSVEINTCDFFDKDNPNRIYKCFYYDCPGVVDQDELRKLEKRARSENS